MIGVEPEGAASMKASIENDEVQNLIQLISLLMEQLFNVSDKQRLKFVKKYLKDIVVVPEGKVCTTILRFI